MTTVPMPGTAEPAATRRTGVAAVRVVGPGGEEITVRPTGSDDHVGDLADALGWAVGPALTIDGRDVERAVRLVDSGLVQGSRITMAPARPASDRGSDDETAHRAGLPEPPTEPPVAVLVVDGGPDAGRSFPLRPGRAVLGRSASAAVSIADPWIETHHALLDVAGDGTVTFTQLAGRAPATVGGDPFGGEPVGGAPVGLAPGDRLVVGSSLLAVRAPLAAPAPLALAASPGDPWRRSVHRAPRRLHRWQGEPLVVPGELAVPGAASGSIVGALLSLAGSVTVAVVVGQPMFMLFGVLGAVVAVGTWVAARLGGARQGRRAVRRRRAQVAEFLLALDAQRSVRQRFEARTTGTVGEACRAVLLAPIAADVWARRPGHGDERRATLGWGDGAWVVPIVGDDGTPVPPGASRSLPDDLVGPVERAGALDDVPVTVDLTAEAAVALRGSMAAAVARSIVVQLAVTSGPADWRLVVVTDDEAAWSWSAWLPHCRGRDDRHAVVDAGDAAAVAEALLRLDDGAVRHTLVVTDRPDLLASRTGSLRRFLAATGSPGAGATSACIVVVGPDDTVPAMCRSVLEIGSLGTGRWYGDVSAALAPRRVHAAGVTSETAFEVARVLAGLGDPELSGDGVELAGELRLGALVEGIDCPTTIAARWSAAGADPAPATPIGLTADGVVELDLVRDGPHGLIAGTTGAGKSELLRTLVASLAARLSPDHLVFVLVDYKGGSTFDACARLPHTVGLVTDLDAGLAERALVSLDAELRRREHLLRAHGAADLGAYRAIAGVAPLPRLVVVIDEFAALAAELPEFLSALVGIAQRGRSLGVHLLLATQRPAGVINDDIRANTSLRIALRLHDTADALDVVGVDGPAGFPRGTPGRAMMRLGPDEHVVFQTARCTGPFTSTGGDRLHVVGGAIEPTGGAVVVDGDVPSELEVLVASIAEAARRTGVASPHRPWLEALPSRVDADEPDVLGIVDVPAAQARAALRWDRRRGNVALVGALGSGTTTALRTIAGAFAAERTPAEGHVYVIDGRGDDALDPLSELDHCAAVVRLHERERLARVLARLDFEIAARAARPAAARGPEIVMLVDGLGQVRSSLDDVSTATELDQLERIVADGPAVGVVTAFTIDVPTAIPATMLMRCAERWVFHLDDPTSATGVGVSAHRVPSAIPGRIVVASRGLDAQLALPGAHAPRRGAGGPPPVTVLPPFVDARSLDVGPGATRRRVAGDTTLVLGLHATDLDVATLDVADGEHVAVIGPVRSGRSTALARIARSWRASHEGGRIVIVCPDRRSPLAALGARRRPGAEGRADLDVGLDVDAERLAGEVAADDRRPCLLVVDDAEKLDDPTGSLAALCASRRPGLLVAVALRPDAARAAYGHWTSVVRRSRLGVMLCGCDEHDGDLLGVVLPRRSPIAARPGLGYLVGCRPGLVQLAVDGFEAGAR
jgi:S-DNA-T family DNA segregation ATPase FtsK/SpoIIIE